LAETIKRVKVLSHLDDEELKQLIMTARALIYPSEIEGFGLPAVEAAACGCPVIATKSSPLPGLLGDGAIYIDPADARDLERALNQVLRSYELRQRMRRAGVAAAARLTWDAAADQLITVLNQMATG